MSTPETKICIKCGNEKSISEFCKDSHKKSGLQSRCNVCNADHSRQWREANPERYRASIKDYCVNNRGLLLEKSRQYRVVYIEKYKASKKAWKIKNPQKVAESHRNRRASKRNAEGLHTAADIRELHNLQMRKCAVCRISIAKNYHVDHVIPLALGGSNNRDNLQLLCPSCNLSKNAQHPVDFMQSRGMLL